MSSAPIEVGADNFTNEVLESKTPVLVDFWAPWCGPCKMIAPLLDKLAEEKGDSLKIVKVNVDEHPQISQRYSVRGIPTLILFRDGDVEATKVGALSRTQLDAFLAPHLP